MKYLIVLDGGLGRTLCALPAIKQFAKKHDTIIITGNWGEAFFYSGLKVIPAGPRGSYSAFIEDRKVLVPEPYYNPRWLRGEITLVEAFAQELNVKLPKDPLPMLPPLHNVSLPHEAEDIDYTVIQPGGSVNAMTMEEMQEILAENATRECPETIFIVGTEETFDGAVTLYGLPVEMYFKLIAGAKKFIGCESSGYHIAAAAGVPHTVYTAETSGYKFYPSTKQVIRPGFEGFPIISPRL